MNVNIADNVKKIRKQQKLTQNELADKLNISRSYLGDIENNRSNPSIKTIEKLADGLGVDMMALLKGFHNKGKEIQNYMSVDELKQQLEELKKENQALKETIDSIVATGNEALQGSDPKEVGSRIRYIRKNLGLSMSAFAKKIDKKAKSGTVSNWETGKNLPNNERLKSIAELGNVPIYFLLKGAKK